MKIFNYNIISDNELKKFKEQSSEEAYKNIISYLDSKDIIPELERLKIDKWDNEAFDRIIFLIKDLKRLLRGS